MATQVQYAFDFDAGTPEDVKSALSRAYYSRDRVRVFYGDAVTGYDWGEEFDTVGTIGRSTGKQKAALLIKNSRSFGGGAILTASIVKIVNITRDCVMYTAPNYKAPELLLLKSPLSGGYEYEVYRKHELGSAKPRTELMARFKGIEQAERYRRFITGARNSKCGRITL